MDINTCFETTSFYHTTAYYSHLIPVAIALFLGVYTLFKTKFSKLAVAFFLFSLSFSIWLINDVILWTSQDYYKIVFFWSWIDYIDVLFFALGAYFFGVLARGSISVVEKILLVLLCVPIFIFTVTGNAITEFYHPVCEVISNDASVHYKVFAEWGAVALMFYSLIVVLFGKLKKEARLPIILVFIAIILFFSTFSITEYFATLTAQYEISLYGLFVLPIFLMIMVFAVTNLRIFHIRYLGTQILVYILFIMIGSQFLFLESSTDKTLNVVTLIVAVLFGYLLLSNTKKEEEAKIKIEELAANLEKTNNKLSQANDRLKVLDKQKSEFLSFASHQLRSPLTAIKGYASLLLEGDYGPLTPDMKHPVQVIFDSTNTLSTVVTDYLNVSRIELGQMKYDFTQEDIKKITEQIIDELRPNVDKAGLQFKFSYDPGEYVTKVDKDKIIQVITNIIDNSVKYTKKGMITVELKKKANNILIAVKDTGIGISKENLPKLFAKFVRAGNANQTNSRGTGLGLYIAKDIIEKHNGKVWVESEGEGKGSQFYIQIPVAK